VLTQAQGVIFMLTFMTHCICQCQDLIRIYQLTSTKTKHAMYL